MHYSKTKCVMKTMLQCNISQWSLVLFMQIIHFCQNSNFVTFTRRQNARSMSNIKHRCSFCTVGTGWYGSGMVLLITCLFKAHTSMLIAQGLCLVIMCCSLCQADGYCTARVKAVWRGPGHVGCVLVGSGATVEDSWLLSKTETRREEEEIGAKCLLGNRCSWKEGSLWHRGGLLKMEPCEERHV